MSESPKIQHDGYRTGTVRVCKAIPGHVDIEGDGFSIRMTAEQAMEFAALIFRYSGLTGPTREAEGGGS